MEEQNLTAGKRKKWLLPTIVAVIVVIAALVSIAIYNLPANRRDRQLALAEKYMSELNYEAAVLAYKAAIEIDPKNVEAYHGAVEAYSLADNKDGFEDLYTDALNVVDELSDDELNATIELVKDIYLSAPNVYDDNEKTAEVLEKGYEVTDNDEDVKNSLVDTYEDIIDECQNDDNPDSEKILDVCDRVIELDKNNKKITGKRRDVLEEYLETVLKDGNSDTAKKLIKKYKKLVPDVDYEKMVETCINDLFDSEDYDTIKKLVNELKEILPDMNLEDILSNIESLKQQAAQKQALLITVFEYMSVEDYDSMFDVDGSEDADTVRDILVEQEKTSYIYIPDADGTYTGTGAGIYLFENGGYYFYYGDFVDGIREGDGSIFMKQDGEYKYIFTGEWKNDAPNGAGNLYSESEKGTANYSGELIDGLWNGYVNKILETYNGTWNLSFDAVNGIPDEISEKEGYYRVASRNGEEYAVELSRQLFSSSVYELLDDRDYGGAVLINTPWAYGNMDTTCYIDIDVDKYICSFDYHCDDDGSSAWWWSYIGYDETFGIVNFAEVY